MGRSPLSRALSIVALVSAALLLSGCFKVNMNMTVNADDTVDGSFIFALQKQFADLAGEEGLDDFSTDEQDLEDLGAEVTIKPYSDDEYVGQEIEFTGAPLDGLSENLAEGGDDFSLTHTDGKYVFDASMDMSSELGGEAPGDVPSDMFSDEMLAQMLAGAEFKISITFPGKVTDSNGDVDGNTVTWDLSLTSPNTLHAEAEEGGALSSASAKVEDAVGIPLGAVIGILVALLVLIGGGLLLWQRSKKPTAPAPAPIAPDATVPPAATPVTGGSEATPTTVLETPEAEAAAGDDGSSPDEPTTQL